MKLFSTPGAILSEIGRMRTAENYRRQDRATVSNFFNGSPPLSDSEAEELGLTVNVNHLFGYRELTDAKDQVFSLFTKPSRLLEVDIDACPAGKRQDWSMKVQEAVTRVLRKIRWFKSAYEGVAGDAALHGEAVFFRPNTTYPLPVQAPLSKILVPDDTPANADGLTHFAIEAELTVSQIHRYLRTEAPGWSRMTLRRILNDIYKNELQEGRSIDSENVEELEYQRQQNSASWQNRRPSVDVIYFFQKRCDVAGEPIDLAIVMKGEPNPVDHDKGEGLVLFKQDSRYPSIHDCIHPFFMDCIIGGAPKWHRVLGLGTLNYQINHAIELLINRAQQATVEGSMNLWQVKDTATREAAQQILLKHNGIIPEGLDLVQNRFAPNYGGILEMIQFFRQQGSKNARGVTANTGDKNDQLEVQAMFEQNLAASSSNARAANWYDYLDGMWEKTFERLTNPTIDPLDPGYSEVMDFQTEMKRHGIPLYYLQPHNVQVQAVRIIGDGLRSKELAAVQFLTANRASYAPEVQPRITRTVTALALDNYKLAEDLTPIQEEADSPQMMRAESENAIMLTQRKPIPPKADDIDELHVMQHFPALETLISDAVQFQKAAFTPQQLQAFEVIGGHTVAHIQRIEQRATNSKNDPEREKARAFMDQLNQVAAMGEKLANNLKQTQEGQQDVDPVEVAKLELQAETLRLQRDKLSHNMSKFDRQQNTREQSMAFEQTMRLEKDRREDRTGRREAAARDIELAMKVKDTAVK